MPGMVRTRLIPVLTLFLAVWAFRITGDPATQVWRVRFRPKMVAAPADWSRPGLRHGRNYAVESRAPRPRLHFSLPLKGAYLLRLFYLLEGERAAEILIGGKRVGRLTPGGGWRKHIIQPVVVEAGRPLTVTFALPQGGKMTLRRADLRNYIFRLGSFVLLKLREGRRGASGWTYPAMLLGGLIVLWIATAGLLKISGREGGKAGLSLLPVGVLSLVLIGVQQWTPYSLHARPGFLLTVFLGLTAVSAVRRFTRPISRKEAAKRAALVAAGLAIALLGAEAALRVWDPPISRARIGSYVRYSPQYGWTNRPNTRGWQVDSYYYIRINRFGHRGPDRPLRKKPGVIRILGLGDSFTFGFGVEEKETFLHQMELRLRAAGHNVEVINAGVGGWHSVQALHYLMTDGARFQPDIVVMSFFVDDVKPYTLKQARNSTLAIRVRNDETETSNRMKKSFARRIRLYNVWFHSQKLLLTTRSYQRRTHPDQFVTLEEERKRLIRDFDKKPRFVAALEKIVSDWEKAQKRLGIPFLLTFIPAASSLHRPEFQGDARTLARLSLKYGLPYVDLLPHIERHLSPYSLYLHPRDAHMSPLGHAVVGKALAEAILKRKWLRK